MSQYKKAIEEIQRIVNFPIGEHGVPDPVERAMIRLAAQGYTNAEIAEKTGMSATNVAYYFRKIQDRYDIAKSDITKHAFARIERVLEELKIG